jgi:hypothetical protein
MTHHDGPADTRMMGIVHAALKRDLLRAQRVLEEDPPPLGRQREALGRHVVWMMDFLHAHHTSEDEGLWPLVRRRNPAAAQLLDSLEADHARIAPASITAREWDEVEQEHTIRRKPTRQLALEGHWLIEDIDTEGYDVVVHKVPALLRFVLIHGFGPAYRRQAAARWTPDRRATVG